MEENGRERESSFMQAKCKVSAICKCGDREDKKNVQ